MISFISVATNLIIWMRTVIKESIHEYHIAGEKLEDHVYGIVRQVSHVSILEHETGVEDGDSILQNIHKRLSENGDSLNDHISVEKCKAMYHDDDFFSDVLKASLHFFMRLSMSFLWLVELCFSIPGTI